MSTSGAASSPPRSDPSPPFTEATAAAAPTHPTSSQPWDLSPTSACGGGEGSPAPTYVRSQLCDLPKEILCELLHSDELAVDCEQDVVHVICDWVADDVHSRMGDLPELLTECVRTEQLQALPLLPRGSNQGPAAAHAAVQLEVMAAVHRIIKLQQQQEFEQLPRQLVEGSTPSCSVRSFSMAAHSSGPEEGPMSSASCSQDSAVSHCEHAPCSGSFTLQQQQQQQQQPGGAWGATQHTPPIQPLQPPPPLSQPAPSQPAPSPASQPARQTSFGRPRRYQPACLVAAGMLSGVVGQPALGVVMYVWMARTSDLRPGVGFSLVFGIA